MRHESEALSIFVEDKSRLAVTIGYTIHHPPCHRLSCSVANPLGKAME